MFELKPIPRCLQCRIECKTRVNSEPDASTGGGACLPHKLIVAAEAPQACPAARWLAAATAMQASRFVARALAAELGEAAGVQAAQDWLAQTGACPWDRDRMEAFVDADRDRHPDDAQAQWLSGALRRLRRRLLLGNIVRDVSGEADLAEITGSMTSLAECAVQHVLGVAARELGAQFGTPTDEGGVRQDLLVVAMGKAGGGELNVSSDLDLVFVYDGEGTTATAPGAPATARPISNQEFFERLGRRLIAVLSEATSEGFVFRVDMRLRPNGDAGPLVVSCAMLEEYLARQGREWERFAWVKARVISTALMASCAEFARQCESLDACVRPFVYRRYLDFNSIGALRDLHARIRRQTSRRAGGRVEARHHVKLGRGGIREIEFIAQTFQVMRGGRDARLRSRSTLATLQTLGELGVLDARDCGDLADSYRLLRRIEHALQYLDDAQTHLIPPEPNERERVALLLGLKDGVDLMARYEAASARVAASFDRIFAAPAREAEAIDVQAADWLPRLSRLGFADAEAAARNTAALLASPRVAAGSEASRTRMAHLVLNALPALSQAAGDAGLRAGIDQVFARWLQLLEVIAGRTTYVALLDEYPVALARVVRLLGAGRWASEYLARHPVLLDELLDERLAGLALDADALSAWARQLQADLQHAGEDPERQMNLLRDAHHAQVFRLLLADLDGRLGVEALADQLSALADATLDVCLSALWRQQRGADAPPPRLAVVAYGKLGGKELGYASDLDLIFVYDDPDPEAPTRYAQLVRRLVTWLSTPTSSGVLFEIDLRLRPNGNAGLLVSSLDAFALYQLNADGHGAWSWEHQALTRARACAGDRALGARIEDVRRRVLAQTRDATALAGEVLAMRERMLQGHPNRTALFDLKHDRGGMVDIEFVVQYLVLAHAHRCPALLDNLGNIALLGIAAGLGLLAADRAEAAAQAYRQYRRLQHGLRLDGAPFARIPLAQAEAHVQAVRGLWRDVFGTDAPLAPAASTATVR